jgi:pimeloyl-ACP methyl ester carboxylesterase
MKKDLLVLHGALGSASQMKAALHERLEPFFQPHYLDFIGHSSQPSPGSFDAQSFARQLESYIAHNQLDQPIVLGYSMGGYMALLLESQTNIFSKIITLGTKYHWSPEVAAREVQMLQIEPLKQKVPAFVDQLKQRHGESHWEEVVRLTADLMLALGNDPALNNPASIICPVYVCRSTDDKMVSKEESVRLASDVRSGVYHEIPNSKHPIEQTNIAELVDFILQIA